MTAPFYLMLNNPPAKKRRSKKRRARATTKTSTAKRRRKRAHTRTARTQEAPPMARRMTAKQLKYFGKRRTRRARRSTVTTSSAAPRRARRRRGSFTMGRRGFVNTAGMGGILTQSAVGAAGIIVGGMVVGKALDALGKDKPADHWTKQPTTAAGAKLALALGVFMLGRKVRAVRKYAPAFAAGIGASAGVDGWNLIKDKLPGMSGYFTDSDPITYAPRMAG